jgi:hypothetical protein
VDRDSLLEVISTEDVVSIMEDLGTDYIKNKTNDNQLYFRTVCHGGEKYKLLFYKDSLLFNCLTEDGIMSLYDVIMGALQCSFVESYQYLLNFKGVKNQFSKGKGIINRNKREIEDLEFLERHLSKLNKKDITLPTYDNSVLNIFDNYYPSIWEDEGLSPQEMQHFGIRMYFPQMKAILSHRNLDGNIIGIRGRSFFKRDIDAGKKYMPLTIQGLTYRHPTGLSLYGLYENIINIKRIKRCILFEGEKSVIKYGSYYGRDNNIALATLGTTISLYQQQAILDMGVQEVISAYDKQYLFKLIESEDKDSIVVQKAIKEYNAYIKKLIKMYKLFCNYCTFAVIFCNDDITLDYKDSPIDKGKEVFSELYSNRVVIESIEELEEELIK